jgi:hypothetical protein
MGLERKLDPAKVAQVLALGLKPHKCGRQPPVHPPIEPKPSKWPTPAYAEKLRRKRKRMKAAA